LQWLQNSIQTNRDNMNNVGPQTSRNFRDKKEGISGKIIRFKQIVRKNIRNLYRGISDFKKVTNLELT